MAHPRSVADWLSIAKGVSIAGFEHGADLFCHHCCTQADNPLAEVRRPVSKQGIADHPPANMGGAAGNGDRLSFPMLRSSKSSTVRPFANRS